MRPWVVIATWVRWRTALASPFGAGLELELDLNLAMLYAILRHLRGLRSVAERDPREHGVRGDRHVDPGDNGWYAQGQMYAGLWGELGVQLDLLFVRFRAPILSMSAAMLLHGNFPNPSGFRGRAAVHFSVLNGAITGDASFYAEAGQQCTLMPAGDPLANSSSSRTWDPRATT
jgi:hypothetical protein